MNKIESPAAAAPEPTKKCGKCGQEKPLSEFNKYSRSLDGHGSYCRECHAIYNKLRNRTPNSALASFTSRQLMRELYARGYKGTLTPLHPEPIDITKL